MKKILFLFAIYFATTLSFSQNMLTYLGNSGNESLFDVTQLSDSTYLACGSADNLNWISNTVPVSVISSTSISNVGGTNKIGFIIQLSSNLQTILSVVRFPANAVEDIRFIKTTNAPHNPTQTIFISGNTNGSKVNNGGYFIARLNNNFINGVPNAIVWAKSIWAEGYVKSYHPWDVTSNGQVYYARGQSHDTDWGSIYKTDVNGNNIVVENWRVHFDVGVGEFYGSASTYSAGANALDFSVIMFKEGSRCDLRSRNWADFNAILPDGNGGTKKGTWPMDALFNCPCILGSYSATGPGYTGYKRGATDVQGVSSIVVNRLDGGLFVGMNFKSTWSNIGDFEPAIIKYDSTGTMKWWNRLYPEINSNGDTNVYKSHDQYVDALAFDYFNNQITVVARVHGNSQMPYFKGNQLVNNPTTFGFQNNFTGNNGNIHLSYIAKLTNNLGLLKHSTYMAEFTENAVGLGAPFTTPSLAGWPNPNAGWPTLNNTDISENSLKVSKTGMVSLVARGRKTITTNDAHQKMVKPSSSGLSCWNQFVRVYSSNLKYPLYSSLIVGKWDTLTQAGGDNTTIYNIFKTNKGIVAVGKQMADNLGVPIGNTIPVANIPAWGNATPNKESGIFAYFLSDSLKETTPLLTTSQVNNSINDKAITIYPNPFSDKLIINTNNEIIVSIKIYDSVGRLVYENYDNEHIIQTSSFDRGLFIINVETKNKKYFNNKFIKIGDN
jgi:hypothetical protein